MCGFASRLAISKKLIFVDSFEPYNYNQENPHGRGPILNLQWIQAFCHLVISISSILPSWSWLKILSLFIIILHHGFKIQIRSSCDKTWGLTRRDIEQAKTCDMNETQIRAVVMTIDDFPHSQPTISFFQTREVGHHHYMQIPRFL